MPAPYPVYVVDDDPEVREWILLLCQDQGMAGTGFAGGEAFLAATDGLAPGCVLLDMRMPGLSGLQVQAELSRRGATMAVVAMTGYGGVATAVRSMKLGAVDFLEKPFGADALLAALAAAAERLDRNGG
jgi:two-component system response regulator FixJ